MRDLSTYKVSAPGYVTLKGRYVTVEPFVREQHLQALWDGLGGMGINPLLLYFAQDDFGGIGMPSGGNWNPVSGNDGDGAKLYIQAGSRMKDVPMDDDETPF